MISRLRPMVGGLALALFAGVLSTASLGHAASADVIPVAFSVRNTNSSLVPCPSDGARYVARGHLVAPQGALAQPGPHAVTLYLHGLALGEFFWRFTAVPGYDYATEMAGLGHISVVIDRLGYDSSGKPQGTQICAGSEADIAHQIVRRLRNGTYQVASPPAPRFDRVALAGHSYGSLVSQVEAYSYRDIDALVVMAWADTGFTPFGLTTLVQTGLVCAQGGQRSEGTSGPTGYAYLGQRPADFRKAMFASATPSVVAAATALRNRDPCGDTAAPHAIVEDLLLIPTITVPVLLVYGEKDALFTVQGGERQRLLYAGSSDVTFVSLPNTGHALTLEQTAPLLRAEVSNWLGARGF
jgi:pimeloyl-ACP methyl ester carboxylesterase